METSFATRQDIIELRHEVEQRFERAEARMDQMDMKIDTVRDELKSELKSQITQSEQRMIIKLGTTVSVAIGVAVMLARLAG